MKPNEGMGDIGKEVKQLNRHLVAVFNFLLTVVGSFVFAYKAVEYTMEKPSFEMVIDYHQVSKTVISETEIYYIYIYRNG